MPKPNFDLEIRNSSKSLTQLVQKAFSEDS